MNESAHEPHELIDASQRLEANLETPVVPGELATWLGYASATCDIMEGLLQHMIEKVHEERYRQMYAEDPGLSSRIEDLRDEDKALLHEFVELKTSIANMKKQNGDRVENQSNSDNRIEQVVERGLAFVIRLRKQEAAISTWYAEAFQRDRGVVD